MQSPRAGLVKLNWALRCLHPFLGPRARQDSAQAIRRYGHVNGVSEGRSIAAPPVSSLDHGSKDP
eukprot:1183795-Rhodomonas_salina.1